jgi:phosphatidylserine/phosphatidylglycerophosphate/cardiolipin synthase-like enzyme
MKRTVCALILFVSLLSFHAALGQGVIINELFNSSTTDEWVELLVVQDSLDMRGWDLRDFSSGGVAQAPLVFTTNALWSSLRAGTIIVITRPEVVVTEDTDPSDYLLILKAGNALYFSGNPFQFAGGSDAIQIRDNAAAHVIGVSWGTANAGSIPAPKVHFTGASTSNSATVFNEDTLPELLLTTSWTQNNAGSSRGAGNTATNNAWIASLRARADGSGSASILPDTLHAGDVGPVAITYRRDTAFTITNLRIIVPAGFSWSQSVGDVAYTNMTATASVSGDTVYLLGVSFAADSTVITIAGLTAPDSTAFYPFRVQSQQAAYGDVAPTPRIVVFGRPEAIAAVKVNDANGVMLRLNQLVTVRGIVTVANEFGGPSYIQDNSGGLGIFGSSFSTAVAVGDEVVVSGIVSPFGGLSEIVSPLLHSIVSSGNPVEPLVLTAAQVATDGAGGLEQYEGMLVRLNAVNVIDDVGSGTWTSAHNYVLLDATDSTQLRIDNSTNLVGAPIPGGTFDMEGVVGQYITTLPYIGGYQVMPRTTADIISTGPIFATFPVESDIQSTGMTISWTTVNNGTSQLRYGATPQFELGYAGSTDPATTHSVVLGGLQPATVYYIQAFSVSGPDTSKASTLIACTASPVAASGAINVYFNKSVNTNIAWFQPALGNQNFPSRIIARIANARRSIDAALYSMSAAPGDDVAAALIAAKNRGVSVRVISEFDNSGGSGFALLAGNGVPMINDRFDPTNFGDGLQHNKFFVIDGRGGAPESVWVWTGSWNVTGEGSFNDYQNSVEIQDPALAAAYTLEFNEMWGSGTAVPNASVSRFGARKTDNTPHRFVIGGRSVECYFSPSDRTNAKIVSAINSAQHSVSFALLTLTRSDVAAALIAQKNAGRKVRGLMDNRTDTQSQYDGLLAGGVDMHLKTGPGLLHHKYGLIDAEYPYWNPVAITGSHNWTTSAETKNNENTLVIRDGNIANQFLQEFAARYYQFGGTDSILVGVEEINPAVPAQFSLSQNYPNPFNPATVIEYAVPAGVRDAVTLRVYDVLGREVATLVNGQQTPGTYRAAFDGRSLASGVYFYRLSAGGFVAQHKMLLLK